MINNFKLISTFKKADSLELEASSKKYFFKKKSFVIGIIGKPGSGKSTIIEEFLLNEELLNGLFEYIFIFSPTKFLNVECIEGANWFPHFSIDVLFSLIDFLNSDLDNLSEKNSNIKVLFVFDDLLANFKEAKTDTKLMQFFYNRRHLLKYGIEISIIMSAQRYMVIPINYRACFSDLILFRLNDRDYKSIKEDSIGYLQIKKLNTLLINDHDFIFISLSDGVIYKNLIKKLE